MREQWWTPARREGTRKGSIPKRRRRSPDRK